MTIAVVIRELTYLKVLQPLMEEFIKNQVPYILYHFDAPRGDKEYNRATLINIKKSSKQIIDAAIKTKAFTSDAQLLQQFIHDKITKLVSIEIYLWAKTYINELKKHNIRTYSLLYLSDSLWQSDPKCITSLDRVYYTTTYLKDTHLNFLNIMPDLNRDRCLGFPIFDCPKYSTGESILILLPNLKSEHIPAAFGNKDRFISIIKSLAERNKLIFKTRKKQWLPKELVPIAEEIVDDGNIMYPPTITDIFKRTHTTVMFYSSGIYEAVWAGQYVVNIPINLKRWSWDKKKMSQYFSKDKGSLYNFEGVVENVEQEQILKGRQLKNLLNPSARKEWISRFIGFDHYQGAKNIVSDIINS